MPELARRLGTGDAVVIGLSSMIGAGVFAAFAPAAAAAGSGLLIGLVLAAAVAYCNARSSAALAAVHPESGGTYIYGHRQLGPLWGFLAGWGFVIGKTASCAAMALTAAAYLAPDHRKAVAVAAVVLLAAVNYAGITRTAKLARVLLALTLLALACVLAAAWLGPALTGGPWPTAGAAGAGQGVTALGVLQSAGLLFFAFAGYARIATLGEEVREPQRTIPRAIPIALGVVVALYAAVAVTLLATLGASGLARSAEPLADAVRSGGLARLVPVAEAGAGIAALGALLALLAGIGRTALAMARGRDLPSALAAVHPRFATPHRAELATAAAVIVLIVLTDLRGAIGFSSFGVLVYYAIANASAFTLPAGQRRLRRAVPVAGAAGCLLLAATLPWPSVVGGLVVFALGVLVRLTRPRS